jgi:two-component system, OmpR family, phosphate regulon sensor histidine kinase PhoR
MAPHRIISALAPALAALLAGAVALAATAEPAGALAAAAFGAAAAAWLVWHAPAPERTPAPPSPASGTHQRATASPAADEHRVLLDALPVGCMVVAADGTIRFANRHAAGLFGLPGTGGMAVATIRVRRLLDCIEAALQHGTSDTVEFSLSRSGEVFLRAHVRPIGGGGDVVVAIEDETQGRRAGESHRDFVANASHELKTPLAAVSGIIETLLGHAREDPMATERFLTMLAGQTERMTRLVEDLLSLNRIELNERVAPREPLDLAGVLGEVVETLRPGAEAAGVRLRYVPLEARTRVRGDRNELCQLFRNLIDNAIKYGGEGTEVSVAMAPARPDAPGLVGVAVRDTGPGIAREHIPRLTERFYRVSVRRSREKGGTGLGLAIVKHVLNRHRGRLEIESRVGEGSCFTAWLPVVGTVVGTGAGTVVGTGAEAGGAPRQAGSPRSAAATA